MRSLLVLLLRLLCPAQQRCIACARLPGSCHRTPQVGQLYITCCASWKVVRPCQCCCNCLKPLQEQLVGVAAADCAAAAAVLQVLLMLLHCCMCLGLQLLLLLQDEIN
jgi:hypothetical protein